MKMSKILLVEDNPRYAGSAEQYLASRRHAVILARDYSQAINRLTHPEFDGMITDCFFPESAGSGNIALGKELVGRMAKSDPHERRIIEGLGVLGQCVDLEDQDARRYARFAAGLYQPDSVIFKALKRIAEVGKEAVTHAFNETFKLIYSDEKAPKDYYGALMKAMEESETNQPLGILLAEKADELSLPFILATSTYHHDILTQPIQNYASSKGWRLIDCGPNREDDKASPEFWERSLGELERKLR